MIYLILIWINIFPTDDLSNGPVFQGRWRYERSEFYFKVIIMNDLDKEIQFVKGIGPKRLVNLSKLGIFTEAI